MAGIAVGTCCVCGESVPTRDLFKNTGTGTAWHANPEDCKVAIARTNAKREVLEPIEAMHDDALAKYHAAVTHPAHYNAHPSGVECITITEAFNFNLGNVIKYVWRAGLKPGASQEEDLRKAAFYLQREIERLQVRK